MSHHEYFDDNDSIDPIDIIEMIAERSSWDFDRVNPDQIAMGIEGQWRTYSITFAQSHDDKLRMITTFELNPPAEQLPKLYELLNDINDKIWLGSFTYWKEQQLIMLRCSLVQTNDEPIEPAVIEGLIRESMETCERFYPAIQLAMWSDQTPEEAMQVAMNEAYGRA